MSEVAITPAQAVEVLNRAFVADPRAMENLILKARVPVNDDLANDPTIQVGTLANGVHDLGFIGLLNGIFGCWPGSTGGYIAYIEEKGRLVGFCETKYPSNEQAKQEGG